MRGPNLERDISLIKFSEDLFSFLAVGIKEKNLIIEDGAINFVEWAANMEMDIKTCILGPQARKPGPK
ncbi:hypothetical protein RchiOBHm_Chr7g0200541 [Rosa chinensis]|uniref:Uncharacterized protein n=1 Tax=Rosa chinensis TaxID=74649 RepID=A0A2P6P7N5_ROSCH|nr:hypothetical protein RchiOBHm_Chr7g0200541 [Rosa chinensis]